MEKTIDRRLFHRLVKGHYSSEYIVLNDGWFHARIWADTEEEAIQIFRSGKY